MYAVVLFINEGDAPAVVPENWFSGDGKKSFWPPLELIDKSEKCELRIEPDQSWTDYPIRILQRGIKSYQEARRLCKLAESQSDLEKTSEKRRRRPVNRYAGECESSDEESTGLRSLSSEKSRCSGKRHKKDISIRLPPSLYENETREVINRHPLNELPVVQGRLTCEKRGFLNPNENENQLLLDGDNFDMNPSESSVVSEVMTLKRKMVHLQQTLDSMGQLMESMNAKMDFLLAKDKDDSKEFYFSMEHYPLKDMESFIENEEKLKEASYRDKCINWLKLTGGYNPKNRIQNVMKKVFLDELGALFSFKGQIRGKFCFCNSGLFKIIQYVLQQVSVEFTDTFLQNVISEWLTQAKFRKERRLARASLREEKDGSRNTETSRNAVASCSFVTSENGSTYNCL